VLKGLTLFLLLKVLNISILGMSRKALAETDWAIDSEVEK